MSQEQHMDPERPGRWQCVHTDAGFHLRLVNAAGEVVLVGEPVHNRSDVADALDLVQRTSVLVGAFANVATSLIEVDERTD